MKTQVQIVLVLLITISLSQQENQYIPGMLMLNTNTPIIVFPAEIYGVNVSYPDNGDSVQIEEFMYQQFAPNSRQVVNEQIIDCKTFKNEYLVLENSTQLKIPNELIKIFNKYHVYSIRR